MAQQALIPQGTKNVSPITLLKSFAILALTALDWPSTYSSQVQQSPHLGADPSQSALQQNR